MKNDLISGCIDSIEIAFSLVEFTYRLQGGLGYDGIVELFQNEVEVKGTLIQRKGISHEEANNFLSNHLHGTLCVFWIAVDEALDDVFECKNPEGASFIDDFRAVIYMFRCAYAHKISQPLWKAKPQYCNRPYRLSILQEHRVGAVDEFRFDFSVLNGQRLKNEEFKGFNGISTLSRVACQLLKDHANLEEPLTQP